MSGKVTLDLVGQYQVGVEQLVYLVWERTTKRHTATEKAPGGKTNSSHRHNSAPLKHVKNVVRLENIHTPRLLKGMISTTGLTRPTHRIPTAGVTQRLA